MWVQVPSLAPNTRKPPHRGGFLWLGEEWLHILLVGLDHLLDHLAADGAGLAAGQVAVVAVLQVDAHLLRCVFTSKISSEFAKLVLKNRQFYTIREQITE